MLVGTVTKQESISWSAHCDIAGIFTQGKRKADAMQALADAFEDVVNRDGFKVTVTAVDGDEVSVDASDPALLLGVAMLEGQSSGRSSASSWRSWPRNSGATC